MSELVIVEKREELGLPEEEVLSRELDGYLEAHWMSRHCVRSGDYFVFFRLCDFREEGGVRHSSRFRYAVWL